MNRAKDKRVPLARRLRRDTTDAERKLWNCLRDLPMGGSHFRRQASVGPYFADFACHAKRLIIELDGGQHAEKVQSQRDAKRDAYLRTNGYCVLRFWNNDVMHNMEGVLEVIAKAITASVPPTPDPSPPQAGGGEPRRETT
jgi:very-short-patch-repair endonuclease